MLSSRGCSIGREENGRTPRIRKPARPSREHQRGCRVTDRRGGPRLDRSMRRAMSQSTQKLKPLSIASAVRSQIDYICHTCLQACQASLAFSNLATRPVQPLHAILSPPLFFISSISLSFLPDIGYFAILNQLRRYTRPSLQKSQSGFLSILLYANLFIKSM